jgi:hypothetical protein
VTAAPGSFCTYFDHWYLPRGLALAASLQQHRPGAVLWVLCLTELCYEALTRIAPAGVRAMRLQDLETADPAFAATRGDRSLTEYYFTSTPALASHLISSTDSGLLTYLDADLFFFADPQPLFDELGDGSVAIIPHRFPPRLRELDRHGVFNVGWVTFRGDENGLACLRAWRDECLEWCHDRVEATRYAEQKYLDSWPERFPGVVVLRHPGANLAPWNIESHVVTSEGPEVRVDGERLIFYHAHGLRFGSPRDWDSGLETYGVTPSEVLNEHVYAPYLRALDLARAEVDAVLDASRQGIAPFPASAMEELAAYDRAWPEREVARLARRSTIERLATVERDSAARLEEITRLGTLLATVDADRGARLTEINRLAGLSVNSSKNRRRTGQRGWRRSNRSRRD